MSPAPKLVIELLDRSHNRDVFDCGTAPLNRYLQRQANQDMKRRISRVFVARAPESKSRVVGFYTLSAISIDLCQRLCDTIVRTGRVFQLADPAMQRLSV